MVVNLPLELNDFAISVRQFSSPYHPSPLFLVIPKTGSVLLINSSDGAVLDQLPTLSYGVFFASAPTKAGDAVIAVGRTGQIVKFTYEPLNPALAQLPLALTAQERLAHELPPSLAPPFYPASHQHVAAFSPAVTPVRPPSPLQQTLQPKETRLALALAAIPGEMVSLLQLIIFLSRDAYNIAARFIAENMAPSSTALIVEKLLGQSLFDEALQLANQLRPTLASTDLHNVMQVFIDSGTLGAKQATSFFLEAYGMDTSPDPREASAFFEAVLETNLKCVPAAATAMILNEICEFNAVRARRFLLHYPLKSHPSHSPGQHSQLVQAIWS